MFSISYIIPTLNEQHALPGLLDCLKQHMEARDEIIVVDGGSTDDTLSICAAEQVKTIQCDQGHRALQMNQGAAEAIGNIFFFIHADTKPPPSFRTDIIKAVQRKKDAGCFRSSFETSNPLLKFNAYCTHFSPIWCRGGDQGLFVKKSVFQALKGFSDSHRIMEDYDMIIRLKERFNFTIIPKDFKISARKYELNNYFRVQWANFLVFRAFLNGASQETMISTYRKWLTLP